ncbi:MAG: hypothetical protein ACI845_002371 [Gammaproteobacteria bacterium]
MAYRAENLDALIVKKKPTPVVSQIVRGKSALAARAIFKMNHFMYEHL